MLIGIVGAPNKGKSTFFASITHMAVDIENYPFTTIRPNKGVAMMRIKCPCQELGVEKCDARVGKCEAGNRMIPINVLDVAGLVPDAHLGKGMGNQFLDDLRIADGFVQVIDGSGKTDLEGKTSVEFRAQDEIIFLQKEMQMWLYSVLKRNFAKFKNRDVEYMSDSLAGLGYSSSELKKIVAKLGLVSNKIQWGDGELLKFSYELMKQAKPIIIAANKADVGVFETDNEDIVFCSAGFELMLIKAKESGLIEYLPGDEKFEIVGECNDVQKNALEIAQTFCKKNKGTGVQRVLRKLIFEKMGLIVVFPVEDENKYCDKQGRVLPDAILLKRGATAIELAAKIHTDLADKFIGAINARTKRKVGKDYVLNDMDIIKIITSR